MLSSLFITVAHTCFQFCFAVTRASRAQGGSASHAVEHADIVKMLTPAWGTNQPHPTREDPLAYVGGEHVACMLAYIGGEHVACMLTYVGGAHVACMLTYVRG